MALAVVEETSSPAAAQEQLTQLAELSQSVLPTGTLVG